MKNTKQYLSCTKAAFLLAIFICLLSGNKLLAQPPVLPAAPNQFFYTTPNPVIGLNNCEFAYTAPGGLTNTILASAYYDGTANPTIYVKDLSLGITASVPSTGNMAGVPDVIIGNYYALNTTCGICINTATDFILAVAFVNVNNQIEVDYYDIFDNGAGSLSITAYGSPTIINGYMPGTVHIDAMVDSYHGNLWSWTFPVCDNFVLAWDDFSCNAPLVYAATCDVSTLTLSPSIFIGMGTAPDVAAVQKNGLSLVPDFKAFITYKGIGGNQLTLANYNFNTSAMATSVLDNGSTSLSITRPRIDAIDDYFMNAAGGVNEYKVVAEVNNGSNTEIRNYDNLLGSSNYVSSGVIDISTVPGYFVSGPYNDFAPTVALGWNWHYNVMHGMNYGGGGNDIEFVEPMTLFSSTTMYMGNYYWINGNSTQQNIDAATCNYANSVTGAENSQNQPMAYAWAWNNGGTYQVDYKNPGTPYSFKAPPPVKNPVNMVGKCSVYPNPASNVLTIKTAETTNIKMSYQVLDVTGRQLLQDDLKTNVNSVDVSKLAAGTYIVKVFKNDVFDSENLFVKQ